MKREYSGIRVVADKNLKEDTFYSKGVIRYGSGY
jgi:hypothetical protein